MKDVPLLEHLGIVAALQDGLQTTVVPRVHDLATIHNLPRQVVECFPGHLHALTGLQHHLLVQQGHLQRTVGECYLSTDSSRQEVISISVQLCTICLNISSLNLASLASKKSRVYVGSLYVQEPFYYRYVTATGREVSETIQHTSVSVDRQ